MHGRRKHSGQEVSEAQEAKRLRDENARLKKLVADLALDKDAAGNGKTDELAIMGWSGNLEHLCPVKAASLDPPVSTYRVTSATTSSAGSNRGNWRANDRGSAIGVCTQCSVRISL